ncbi:hypothetical protein [Allonocardiopsis opalescens]|uniref:Uncharacterized protein n=1 Tax=Allonocardiopsis opalescens TaxID=1144618 RepID=A0A2T0PSR2_9ACTN|nr:hypothetical protein [Allonocardiopsis opalescens]PRX91941.1 hypothetical protein CLV72_11214 [Allonocardiopsis opalescens]
MTEDELSARRRIHRSANPRPKRAPAIRPAPEPVSVTRSAPAWVTKFVIPRDACEACARHWHHRCHGVDILRDPIPDCPCDCGDRRDPMRLGPEAWADLALHAPDQVWVAGRFEALRAGGIHGCVMDDQERLDAAWQRRGWWEDQ